MKVKIDKKEFIRTLCSFNRIVVDEHYNEKLVGRASSQRFTILAQWIPESIIVEAEPLDKPQEEKVLAKREFPLKEDGSIEWDKPQEEPVLPEKMKWQPHNTSMQDFILRYNSILDYFSIKEKTDAERLEKLKEVLHRLNIRTGNDDGLDTSMRKLIDSL